VKNGEKVPATHSNTQTEHLDILIMDQEIYNIECNSQTGGNSTEPDVFVCQNCAYACHGDFESLKSLSNNFSSSLSMTVSIKILISQLRQQFHSLRAWVRCHVGVPMHLTEMRV
jgi:hypothetical protein